MNVGPLVSGDWLAAHRDEVAIFDSRSYMDGRNAREAFLAGHIPGAVFVDLNNDLSAPAAAPGEVGGRHPFPDSAAFAAAMGRLGYDGSRPAVIYDDVAGGIAGRLRFMLRLVGIEAAILDGGLAAYPDPLETGPVTPTTVTFPERRWPAERLVAADAVQERLDSGGVVIDARNASRYAGTANTIDDRFGHIPGASSFPWEDNVDDFTGTMLTLDQLRERFASVVDAANDSSTPRVVAYCGSGVTACHNLLALELLGVEADLYVGSWSEWGSNPDRPLATG